MKPVTVIHHSADFDGLFCREIARKFLGNDGVKFIGWDYGDAKIPWPADSEQVYVLDLSPECLVFPENWEQVVAKLIWIDHHKTAIERCDRNIPGYRIDGVAACRLTWQWFFIDEHNAQNRTNEVLQLELPGKQAFTDREVTEPWAVRLAGEYDIWDKRDSDAEVFQHGLRGRELSEEDWKALLRVGAEGMVLDLLADGKPIQYAQQKADASVVKWRSFRAQFQGLKFLCLNTPRCNSLTFQSAVLPDDDALMGFFWNGTKWKVSLYGVPHKPDVDLSLIAKSMGGGGHKQACGFEYEFENFPELLRVRRHA